MTWHYRALRHPDGTLALHEVYCDENGRPNGFTERPVSFAVDRDEGIDGLAEILRRALNDVTSRPVLDTVDLG